MQYLCIQNRGEVDPQALTLLGASVKEGESIGFFGSGNKYAIASVLRIGLSLRIFSGEREIILETRPQNFRNETFQVLHVDGQPTSITTRTGPKWEIRDAIREFYSNALDEGECVKFHTSDIYGESNTTKIFIEINDEITVMLQSWHNYFLDETLVPLDDNAVARIYPPNPANYFRKGVWICEDRDSMGYFTYDFKEFDLPESRKVSSYSVFCAMQNALSYCISEVVFATMLKHVTGNICGQEWNVLRHTTQNSGKLVELFRASYDLIGTTKTKEFLDDKTTKRVLWCDDDAYKALSYQGISSIESTFLAEDCYQISGWPIGYHERVKREINILGKNGVEIDLESVRFGIFNDSDTIAQFDKDKKIVILCSRAFELDNLRKALIEEWTHKKHNCLDGTSHQQHVYLDLICDLMEKNND
jgi:hypothetical protein